MIRAVAWQGRPAKSVVADRQIGLLKVQPGPEEFRLHIFGDDTRVRRTQQRERTREAEGQPRIEATWSEFPQEQVGEEAAHSDGRVWMTRSADGPDSFFAGHR